MGPLFPSLSDKGQGQQNKEEVAFRYPGKREALRYSFTMEHVACLTVAVQSVFVFLKKN